MKFPRSSGILLHPTSLPGRYGIGDLGPEAHAFADWLAEAGQTLWQVLPLGPTGYGDSPYQLFSAFAGNPMLISPDLLLRDGVLTASDVAHPPSFPEREVDFGAVIEWKTHLLHKAYGNFSSRASDTMRDAYSAFCASNAEWLDPFTLFMARKEAHPDPDEIRYGQFCFFTQYEELKQYCHARHIRLMGDVPIYVAYDSADVWQKPEDYRLDVVSGVPPDYFSATGQLWGNPIYRWDKMETEGFPWWIRRLRASFALFDLIRLDHFRGFEAYWEVPAGETTAVNGRWVNAPGTALFTAAQQALGELPIVAENLGVITPEVEAIRERFGFPGMAVLQFGFGSDPQAPEFRPHNYPRERFAYSGTHDNDTTVGWWESTGAGDSTRTAEEVRNEKQLALDYLAAESSEINWAFIRALMASVACTVVFPLQDVFGAGSEARMNTPGKSDGNWRWRFPSGALTKDLAERLRRMTQLYER
ncbi:MAG: 4-alpha-glucanotransferase [Acidobacteriota bacterium]|nr:4-alpha-glucanotransferase [Acidobacteriota bacterium]